MSSVLLLADDNPNHADTVLDHIEALSSGSRHTVYHYNPLGVSRSRFLHLSEFDAVVIHYSVVLIIDYYLSPWFREQLRNYDGLKIQFIQDEMRWVDRMRAMMKHLAIDIVFTVAPDAASKALYGQVERLETVLCLTGYVPDRLVGRNNPPIAQRAVDVGYRGRTLPYWLGALSQEKRIIGEQFARRAPDYGLNIDIGWTEEERVYGPAWSDFLSSCKATLATESGASISDFDGSIEAAVLHYLEREPEADFETVSRAVLAPHEENLPIRAISPRIFEAAAHGTALILFPGVYSGLLEPYRHYIPLQKDFSNMDEVVARLKDTPALESMARRTYDDLIGSGAYSYRVLSDLFDRTVERGLSSRGTPGRGFPWRYYMALLEKLLFSTDLKGRLRGALRKLHTVFFG